MHERALPCAPSRTGSLEDRKAGVEPEAYPADRLQVERVQHAVLRGGVAVAEHALVPMTIPNSVTQSAESTALMTSRRPLGWKPPSTAVAAPEGRPEFAITGSGSSPQIASTAAGSSNPAVTPRFPFHTFHATAPWSPLRRAR